MNMIKNKLVIPFIIIGVAILVFLLIFLGTDLFQKRGKPIMGGLRPYPGSQNISPRE